ncbi:MAG TPA: hypothetical protein VFA52_00875 [Candidatus Paceibacterota bacterium]|nr:hypothetical protein [Candidatus Paceibacterota bacterium]
MNLLFFLPSLAEAQSNKANDFKSLVQLLISLLNALVPLIIGIALVAFLWGVMRYVTGGQSEEKIKQGRTLMIYGIIALFVMVAVWGLVGILESTFFGGTLAIPQLR